MQNKITGRVDANIQHTGNLLEAILMTNDLEFNSTTKMNIVNTQPQ